jgi:chemotaxis protein methyltransferase CheR
MNRNLTDIELSMVCEVIASRMGLHFPVFRWTILVRNLALAGREFGFQNLNDFFQWFLSTEPTNDQIKILATHLTVSETYFWREPNVFSALTDYILPELIREKKKGEKNIRIWSAGSSTGEEAYSLAIAIHKAVPDMGDWNISIMATDINPVSVDKAKAGIYGPWSFRNVPDWLKDNYFLDLGDRKYEVKPEIRKMVNFSCISLTRDDFYSDMKDKMDIIFCRNVLMYFTSEWVNKISHNLYNSLSENGWFVVSSSELSSYIFPQYKAVNFPGAVFYTKSKNESLISLTSKDSTRENLNFLSPVDSEKQNFTSLPSNPFIITPSHTITPSTLQHPSLIVENHEDTPPETSKETTDDKIFAIRLMANQGYLPESLTLCNEAIELEKLAPGLYYIRASILQEMGKNPEAITSLKQSIYIDPDYIMGHFTLGNLFICQGNHKDARRYFNNALVLLNNCKSDAHVPESEGLSVKYIREIIFANMQLQLTK